MKVICISGKAQHGKDTTAGILKTLLEADGKKVLIAHYGDLVKYICRQFFDWNGIKDERGRTMLQYVGTDVVRTQDENYWVNFLTGVLRLFRDEWDYVLVPDCRFPNEIDRVKEDGFEVVHIRVIRKNFVSPLTPEQQAHPSETALDDVVPDICVINDGTLYELREKLSEIVTRLEEFHQISFEELGIAQ